MATSAQNSGNSVERRSALRKFPLPPERVEAERAIREGQTPKVIIGVTDDQALEYAAENELVALFNSIPFSIGRRRPRNRFGNPR